MTTYEFYEKIARILAKDNWEALYSYIIYSTDDIGLSLRSRYCRGEKALPNEEYGEEPNTILIALNIPFDFSKSTDYYETHDSENSITKLKMQIFLNDLSEEVALNGAISKSMAAGFLSFVRVNLTDETFDVLPEMKAILKDRSTKKQEKCLKDFLD